ncbi:MAG TPA: hypothetical protein VHV79_09045 [Mycobacteriales bacterium]|jgi:hypothetical protein|nr:hypothetical protein [Mycobacteriales bacterium]
MAVRLTSTLGPTAIIGCGGCGAETVLAVERVVKAAEITAFVSAHASHKPVRILLHWIGLDHGAPTAIDVTRPRRSRVDLP